MEPDLKMVFLASKMSKGMWSLPWPNISFRQLMFFMMLMPETWGYNRTIFAYSAKSFEKGPISCTKGPEGAKGHLHVVTTKWINVRFQIPVRRPVGQTPLQEDINTIYYWKIQSDPSPRPLWGGYRSSTVLARWVSKITHSWETAVFRTYRSEN